MTHGFTVYLFNKDWFYKTEQTKRSKRLAMEVLNSIQNHLNKYFNIGEHEIKYVFDLLKECELETKTVENGTFKNRKYHSLYGNDFGIVGGFIGENDEIICLNMEV